MATTIELCTGGHPELGAKDGYRVIIPDDPAPPFLNVPVMSDPVAFFEAVKNAATAEEAREVHMFHTVSLRRDVFTDGAWRYVPAY